jgi:hypothetical protein
MAEMPVLMPGVLYLNRGTDRRQVRCTPQWGSDTAGAISLNAMVAAQALLQRT